MRILKVKMLLPLWIKVVVAVANVLSSVKRASLVPNVLWVVHMAARTWKLLARASSHSTPNMENILKAKRLQLEEKRLQII